ncbi:hypothetical protein PybrP1_006610 [[Pythium] brassicae (nom. inval.)]|nr:hypothetical protein PybrP1_006610 [[Pythium] brassicae (nom. inval.)]
MADVSSASSFPLDAESGGGRNSLLSPALEAAAPERLSDERSFGDLLAQLLRTLPTDASTLFLKSLSGLSPAESGELCAYVAQLKDEKQFRVIRAMADSTPDGKKKFLASLRRKFAQQQATERAQLAQHELDLESHMKRKQALSAAARVKMLNGGAKQYHSMNAVLGAKENVASGGNAGLTAAALASHNVGPNGGVSRALSSSSVVITKEDIRDVGQLLGDAHISESEQNLRELEISRFALQLNGGGRSNGSHTGGPDAAMDAFAKRERPESSRALARGEEKALQRTRSQQERSSSGDSPSRGSLSDSQDGDDGADGDGDGGDGGPDDPDAPTTKRWTKSQDAALRESVRIHGEKNWKAIAELVPGRNHAQCLQRWRKVLKPGLVKGHWSFEEDQVLEFLVTQGCNNWGQIAERIPGRTPKQCRERWKNHLDPAINKGPYTEDEDAVILAAQERLGNKWSQIAQLLKGRTEDSVKIRWKSLKQNPSKAAAVKDEAYSHSHSHSHHHQQQQQQQQTRLLPPPQMTMEQLYAAYPPQSFVAQHAVGGAPQFLDDYSYRYASQGGVAPAHLGDQSDDDAHDPHSSGNGNGNGNGGGAPDGWDLQQDLTDSLGLSSRLGEHPPPSSFWETYPKQPATASLGGAEPLPLALHSMFQDQSRTPTAGGSLPHHQQQQPPQYATPDDDFNEAMFEKLATELGGQDMHFGPI